MHDQDFGPVMRCARRRKPFETDDTLSGRRRARLAIHAVAFVCCALPAAANVTAAEPSAEDFEFFEKKVRPLLVQHCRKCHGPEKQEGGLRLDSRDGAFKGGENGPPVIGGKPDESLLLEAVAYDGAIRMPPKGKLPDDEISLLNEWVKRGAPWPPEREQGKSAAGSEFDLHARKAAQWAFQPLQAHTPPPVRDSSWLQSPVDAFVLAKLQGAGLRPAPPADKRRLIRRVTFDLIGLPPTEREIDAFLADDSPLAFEKIVDRLLSSPHYGERWGRHWLDLVRYAETAGHEFDFEIPHAWQYRDYVVRAFNADLPYDQFVIEQVAGDLLPEPRRNPAEGFNESIIGTGFWHLGESKHSPVDVRADEADRFDNQIDVFGKAFLGQTLGCARCHDHKFDALSTKDYYALSGYLQSSRMQYACVDAPEERQQVVARLEKLRNERAALLRDLPRPASRPVPATREGDVTFADFSARDFRDWFVAGEAFGRGPVADPRSILSQPGRGWPSGASTAAHSGALAGRLEGVLRSRTFTIEKNHIHYLAAGKDARIHLIIDNLQHLRNPIYGSLAIPLNEPGRMQWHRHDVAKWIGHNAYIELVDPGEGFLAVERIVFSDASTPPFEPAVADEKEVAPSESVAARLAEVSAEQLRLEAEIHYRRKVVAMVDGTGEDDFVHVRGNPNKFGDLVPRRFLEAIAGGDQPPPANGSGRLELARRLVDASNPLLPRAIVNRLWKHHFGEGLVRTPDDFGNMGQPPTHPELLDYLAMQLNFPDELGTPPLRKGGQGGSGSTTTQAATASHAPPPDPPFPRGGEAAWSLKRVHRLMVLSSTYRMASRAADPHAEEVDPQNKLWHRMNLRRLEGEIIRDAMLAASGRLDRRMYGPGVLPHLTPFMAGRGRPEKSGPLDGDGRRSVYINVRRNFLTPLFLAFDYPVPFSTMGRRSVSNVPAQALALMNNPFVVQQSEAWARRVAAEHADDGSRLNAMYVSAFGRVPTEAERQTAKEFLTEQSRHVSADTIAPWADLAHVLFNVKEFIVVE